MSLNLSVRLRPSMHGGVRLLYSNTGVFQSSLQCDLGDLNQGVLIPLLWVTTHGLKMSVIHLVEIFISVTSIAYFPNTPLHHCILKEAVHSLAMNLDRGVADDCTMAL